MDRAWSRGGHCYLVWVSEVDAGGTCRRHWRPAPSRRRPSGWRGSCPGGWPWAAPSSPSGARAVSTLTPVKHTRARAVQGRGWTDLGSGRRAQGVVRLLVPLLLPRGCGFGRSGRGRRHRLDPGGGKRCRLDPGAPPAGLEGGRQTARTAAREGRGGGRRCFGAWRAGGGGR